LAEQALVSICIPTANRAKFLQQSLPTICGQKYAPIEIVISDNASTDGTERFCRELAENDPRVRYVRQPVNLGIWGNHNACIELARGPLLCIFHDDDIYEPDIVGEYVEFMQAHPNVGVVCSDFSLIDDEGRTIANRQFGATRAMPGETLIEQTLRSGRSSVAVSGAMMRRSAIGDLRFTTSQAMGFADFVMWFGMAETSEVGHIGRRLWSYRLHSGSLSRLSILQMASQYHENLFGYCDDRLRRQPDLAPRLARYRAAIDNYLFWALLYEVARHVRVTRGGSVPLAGHTIFDLGTYTLTDAEFREAVAALGRYGKTPMTRLVRHVVTAAIAAGLTRPLEWAARWSPTVRAVLGLR